MIASLAGLAAIVSVLRPASADQDRAFKFIWQAPAGCPSTDELLGGIARLLGGVPRVSKDGGLEARASVKHEASWAVSIETESEGRVGRRFIEAVSCQDLADATALIIALMIDPDAVAAHTTESRSVAKTPATAAHMPANVSRTTDVLLALHAAGSRGTLPGFDVGLGAGLGLAGRHWRLELRGTYGLRRDQKAVVNSPAGAYGRFNFAAAGLAGCLDFGSAGLGYGVCADGELGVVSAEGVHFDEGSLAHTVWWALGAGVFTAVPLGRSLRLPVHADVLSPVHRPEFVFTDDRGAATRVFRAPAVGIRLSAGLELAF